MSRGIGRFLDRSSPRATNAALGAISEDGSMRKPLPSISTRTEEFTPRDLPLRPPSGPPPARIRPERRASDRIKEALLRWLEEEL
jgi:hypothetical protein